ncbi:hypothetical protein BpHYR1_022967 [Brachionus plicatilis]|uniref:Uncharacterized protein n=1 Tax=Brachionus plicatilis TaxID=10195 RepID=A0A3M7RAJ6_BRAPC|nr:hypothetical protein BpHYR1_022967 [Brachionus plicatilis]
MSIKLTAAELPDKVPISDALAKLLSGKTTNEFIIPLWPCKVLINELSFRFQMVIFSSPRTLAIFPSAKKHLQVDHWPLAKSPLTKTASDVTGSVWPKSHILIVLSVDALAMRPFFKITKEHLVSAFTVLSLDFVVIFQIIIYLLDTTLPPLTPLVLITDPFIVFQYLIVLSLDPLTKSPFGKIFNTFTLAVWLIKVLIREPFEIDQIFIV